MTATIVLESTLMNPKMEEVMGAPSSVMWACNSSGGIKVIGSGLGEEVMGAHSTIEVHILKRGVGARVGKCWTT